MSKLLYMNQTIQLLGKKNPKKTDKLIKSGQVVKNENYAYLVKEDKVKRAKVRKTLDGRVLQELDEPMALIVNTKVPRKWILQDTETGEIYRGTTKTTIGDQWEKITQIKD